MMVVFSMKYISYLFWKFVQAGITFVGFYTWNQRKRIVSELLNPEIHLLMIIAWPPVYPHHTGQ